MTRDKKIYRVRRHTGDPSGCTNHTDDHGQSDDAKATIRFADDKDDDSYTDGHDAGGVDTDGLANC